MKALAAVVAVFPYLKPVMGFVLPNNVPLSSSSKRTLLTSTSTTSSPTSASNWETFDYMQRWYPVVWECDVRVNTPTKVTLFDQGYVVAIDKDRQLTALLDCCPHKQAALSEGRVTATGFIQCAYHGWTFDRTGKCQQVPQAPQATITKRMCAQAVPAKLHQTMIWLWIGEPQEIYPDPPSIPEMDDPNFVVTRVIRDFPDIDWTLLVSNILDADHGLFAHQAKPFDLYSANAEYPLAIEQNYTDTWYLKTSVPAVDKLLEYDRSKRGTKPKKKKKSSEESPPLATSIFQAPTTISMSRRNPNDNSTSFVSGFWVCPTGTGRSRFMAASIAKAPSWVKIPRWVYHYNLNNFLDQDTVLVASQQPPVLNAELSQQSRSKLYSYASPTDKSVRLIDQFWDATSAKAPNRAKTLQMLHDSGKLQHIPDRKIVLDREVQHLKICPDSQDTVRNCRRLRNTGMVVVASFIAMCLWERTLTIKGKWLVGLAAAVAFFAEKIRQSYYFMYPESKRNRDLKGIPTKMWMDVE